MRICCPVGDTPVFTCPPLSTSDYEWSRKSLGAKFLVYAFAAGMITIMIYANLVGAAHRWLRWNDLTLSLIGEMLNCLMVAAMFPLIVFPVMFLFLSRRPNFKDGPRHVFYGDWASIFRRPVKGGGHVCFFVEDVERFELQQSFYQGEPIYLVKAKFKWIWKPVVRRGDNRFILRVPDVTGLEPFLNWARTGGIPVRFLEKTTAAGGSGGYL